MMTSRLLETIPFLIHGFGTRRSLYPDSLVTAQQVHGTGILWVKDPFPQEPKGFDTLMTDRAGVTIAVKTADCLPILLAEPQQKIVAAVHAGWRGTLARVVQKAVDEIVSHGGKAGNLVACLGPHILGDCYEVGEDVQTAFSREFNGWTILRRKSESKWLLDVASANFSQLLEAGVHQDRIDRIDLCTHCRSDLFYSYRREGTRAGRMMNFIALKS